MRSITDAVHIFNNALRLYWLGIGVRGQIALGVAVARNHIDDMVYELTQGPALPPPTLSGVVDILDKQAQATYCTVLAHYYPSLIDPEWRQVNIKGWVSTDSEAHQKAVQSARAAAQELAQRIVCGPGKQTDQAMPDGGRFIAKLAQEVEGQCRQPTVLEYPTRQGLTRLLKYRRELCAQLTSRAPA